MGRCYCMPGFASLAVAPGVKAVLAAALAEYPGHPALGAMVDGDFHPVAPPAFDAERRPPVAGLESRLERATGLDWTFQPIHFLEVGVERAKAVALVRCGPQEYGTGFLVGGDLLVTCHHVLPDVGAATQAEVWFDYRETPDGLRTAADVRRLAPARAFATSRDDDWTAVQVEGSPGERWGRLVLGPGQPPRPRRGAPPGSAGILPAGGRDGRGPKARSGRDARAPRGERA